MRPNEIVVAVDGPSASGKSTVSRKAASELGFIYVDSGSFYRGITWKAIRESVDVQNPEAVVQLLQRINFEVFVEDLAVRFRIDGEEPGDQIRSMAVHDSVAHIAVIPEVRKFIVSHLQETVRFGPIVMEGRDIGSVVFPDSPFKFYIDADPEERARRRHNELAPKEKKDVETVLNSLARRDKIDTTRKTAPLQIALGARVINTTTMSIDEVVAEVVDAVRSAKS